MKNMWWIAHLFYFFLIEFALRKVHFWVGAHERFEHFLFWKNGWKCSENSHFFLKIPLIQYKFFEKNKTNKTFCELVDNLVKIWNSFFVKTFGGQLMISFFFFLIEFALWKVHFWVGSHEFFHHIFFFLFIRSGFAHLFLPLIIHHFFNHRSSFPI